MNNYFLPTPEKSISETSYFTEVATPSTGRVIEEEYISEEKFKDYSRSITRTVIEKYDLK